MDNIDSEGWKQILSVFPEMDFTAELAETPTLANFLRSSINKHSLNIENPLELETCPKLDTDFSKFIILNGLPKAKPDKLQKLNDILLKILNEKLGCSIKEENIEHSFDENGEKTTGTVFLQLRTESEAKITAQSLNGW